jgi:hypothetical protein
VQLTVGLEFGDRLLMLRDGEMSQRLHFVNYEQVPLVDHLVHTSPLLLEYHQSCFATPRRFWPNAQFTGCLYGDDGQVSSLSQRPSSGAAFQPIDPETLSPVPGDFVPQPGRAIYLGNLFSHFGHFVLESLSRMWPIRSLGMSFDTYYFHGWDGVSSGQMMGLDFARTCFKALGIPIERVRLIPDTGVRLSSCLIPQQLLEVNRQVHELFGSLFASIVDYSKLHVPQDGPKSYDRLYLSRLDQPRRAENEEDIESIFRDLGFLVVAPEKLTFGQQLALVSEAKIVAGCAGSNMHLAAFAKNASIISLDHRIVRNQFLLEVLREHTAHHIWVLRERISETRWIADVKVILASLEAVLPSMTR